MILEKIALETWSVLGQMAPYLLLGFLVAGVLSVCVSPAWVERHLGGGGWKPVVTASLFGVPLPLCSCGVIPVSASIRRHGASPSATTSFLLSTPQTGVDSIAVTYALLGPVFAVFRPLAALLTGLAGGCLVQLFGEPGATADAESSQRPVCQEDCCAGGPRRNVVLRVLHYGFVTLPRDIGAPLLVGVVLAGLLAALVPADRLKEYLGGGILSILLLMAAGVPLYVCATASVPIAVGLIHVGASPGAALAFLIAGPATNAATLAVVWKLLGRRTAVLYLATVAVSAIACGLVLDWLAPTVEAAVPELGNHEHKTVETEWFTHAGAIALLATLALSSSTMARLLKRKRTGEYRETDGGASADQHRLELAITGMTCSHCAEAVRRALAECQGVRSAEVHLADGRAMVVGNRLDREQLAAVVAELGYAARSIHASETQL